MTGIIRLASPDRKLQVEMRLSTVTLQRGSPFLSSLIASFEAGDLGMLGTF
jgi:hypothetical protein